MSRQSAGFDARSRASPTALTNSGFQRSRRKLIASVRAGFEERRRSAPSLKAAIISSVNTEGTRNGVHVI